MVLLAEWLHFQTESAYKIFHVAPATSCICSCVGSIGPRWIGVSGKGIIPDESPADVGFLTDKFAFPSRLHNVQSTKPDGSRVSKFEFTAARG